MATPIRDPRLDWGHRSESNAISTRQLAHGISEIDTTARSLRDQAAELELLVNRFTIDDSSESSARASRMLTADRAVALHR
jgi:hypothetical protein